MFAVFNSSNEKINYNGIAEENETQLLRANHTVVYRLEYISDSMDEFRQLSIKNIVISS